MGVSKAIRKCFLAIFAGAAALVLAFSAAAQDTSTNLDGIKHYLLEKTAELSEATAEFRDIAVEFLVLAQAADFDYEALAQDPDVTALILAARDLWITASPLYEQMEGIVAGVPTLAEYDVILDAGVSGAEAHHDAVYAGAGAGKRRITIGSSRGSQRVKERLADGIAQLSGRLGLRCRRPIIMGAGLALAATTITWVIANQLLVLMLPLGEKLEAIVSLIAIAVLLLITNWFFHKVYWTGWMANFHQRKKRLIGGIAVITISQAVGLIILGFTSIYREGFETVLFLQSLVLEAGIGVVLQGVLLGSIGVLIVGFITFSLQMRLPYKKMLIVTGVMIGFVLVVMVGNTVHVMQSVGWLPITPIPGLRLPLWMGQWFGVYATMQGIALQVGAAVFVIGSYFLAEHQQKMKRHHRASGAQAAKTA